MGGWVWAPDSLLILTGWAVTEKSLSILGRWTPAGVCDTLLRHADKLRQRGLHRSGG
jgi:hypothetical protein